MRLFLVLMGLLIALPSISQESPKKKTAAKKQQQVAHKKPTPEQIRKFKDLEKKQKR